MEAEFDKEIDALMRGGLSGRSSGGAVSGDHLAADELAAFAENALPGPARQQFARHLADCDRCRKILSGLIAMNADAEPSASAAAVTAPAPASSAAPWYRRLLLFPNLAYLMGGLVLVFGGLLTYSVLRQGTDGAASIARSEDQLESAASRPEPNSANSAAANTASNSDGYAFDLPPAGKNQNASARANTANTASSPLSVGSTLAERKEPGRSEGLVADGAENQPRAAAPAAPAKSLAPPPVTTTDAVRDKDLLQMRAGATAPAEREKKADAGVANESRQTVDEDAKRSGSVTLQKLEPKAKARPRVPTSRQIDGKQFNYRNGVWYDADYNSQKTTNVRRGTAEFGKLDAGLRSIAGKLSGTIVVVWNARAYRIQ